MKDEDELLMKSIEILSENTRGVLGAFFGFGEEDAPRRIPVSKAQMSAGNLPGRVGNIVRGAVDTFSDPESRRQFGEDFKDDLKDRLENFRRGISDRNASSSRRQGGQSGPASKSRLPGGNSTMPESCRQYNDSFNDWPDTSMCVQCCNDIEEACKSKTGGDCRAAHTTCTQKVCKSQKKWPAK